MVSYPIRNVAFDRYEQHINGIELGFEYFRSLYYSASSPYGDNCSVRSFPDDYWFDIEEWGGSLYPFPDGWGSQCSIYSFSDYNNFDEESWSPFW